MIAPVVEGGEDGIEMATPAPVPAQPDARWFAPSERVVLLPPDSVTRSMPLDGTLEQPLMEELGRPAKMTGNTSRTAVDGTSGHASLRWWAVAAALVVGATATLSAQAVMRNRGRVTTAPAQQAPQEAVLAATPAPVAPTLPDPMMRAEAEDPTPVAPVAAAPALQATVVQSTATLPGAVAPTDAPQEEPGARLIAVSSRARSGRTVARAMARPPAEARGTRAPAVPAGRWVDPFAGETIPGFVPRAALSAQAKPNLAKPNLAKSVRAGASASGSTTASNNTWVDPFVN